MSHGSTKRLVHEANHSTLSNAEVKNERSHISSPQQVPSWCVKKFHIFLYHWQLRSLLLQPEGSYNTKYQICWVRRLNKQHTWKNLFYTVHFIMFSMTANIHNKKTKGPTLKELFTATGKLKKLFLTTRDVQCVHRRWHGTHRYDIQVLATHTCQQGCFLLAETPSFSKLFIPRTNGCL